MRIKKFKNGNFNFQREPFFDEDKDLLFLLCDSIELDFELKEADCGMGYIGGHRLYNANTDKEYFLSYKDIDDFKKGRTVKLVAA